MKKHAILIFVALLFLWVASCKSSVSADDLYGKWKYIKVAHPHADPPDSVRKEDIAYYAPYIQFTTNNTLIIMWGGKLLSHGKFSIDGHNINYTESLANGTTRKFPFWVSELTDKEIIFETKGDDGSRVTAVKE
ncbi:MAG TPA: hypothetical protein VNX40_12630 [Mucilaginibacter sp.]|jgi:hypothetical protein|nr:hypothetical protein [Mucilaginibacter sp.]